MSNAALPSQPTYMTADQWNQVQLLPDRLREASTADAQLHVIDGMKILLHSIIDTAMESPPYAPLRNLASRLALMEHFEKLIRTNGRLPIPPMSELLAVEQTLAEQTPAEQTPASS